MDAACAHTAITVLESDVAYALGVAVLVAPAARAARAASREPGTQPTISSNLRAAVAAVPATSASVDACPPQYRMDHADAAPCLDCGGRCRHALSRSSRGGSSLLSPLTHAPVVYSDTVLSPHACLSIIVQRRNAITTTFASASAFTFAAFSFSAETPPLSPPPLSPPPPSPRRRLRHLRHRPPALLPDASRPIHALPVLPCDIMRMTWQRTRRLCAAAVIVRALLKWKARVWRYVSRYVLKSRGSRLSYHVSRTTSVQ